MIPERLREIYDLPPQHRMPALLAEIAALEERNRALEQQVAFQADDVKKLDELCWDCTDPDVGAPWRHVHEIDGKERAHWHHTPDPGDGLPSACKNSDRLEEVFQETQQHITELESTVQAQAEELLAFKNCGDQECTLELHHHHIGQAETIAKLREALTNVLKGKSHSQQCDSYVWGKAVKLMILGCCYSMKNSKIPRRNAPGMLKHPKARQFERDFLLQVRPEHRKELGSKKRPLRATVRAFFPSLRQDADVELVFDLLQKSHVVMNDRYIREKHIYAEVDTKNPRCEIEVEEL